MNRGRPARRAFRDPGRFEKREADGACASSGGEWPEIHRKIEDSAQLAQYFLGIRLVFLKNEEP